MISRYWTKLCETKVIRCRLRVQSIHQLLLNELLQQHIYEKLSVHVVRTVQSIIYAADGRKTLQYN